MNQLYILIYPLFFRLISHIDHYWVELPVLYSRSLLVTCFRYSSVYMSIQISRFIPWPLSPGNHKFVFYMCNSYFCFVNRLICTIFFFFRFHILVISYDICLSLSNLLHSLWQYLGSPTLLQMTLFHSFWLLSNILLYICTTSLSIALSVDI